MKENTNKKKEAKLKKESKKTAKKRNKQYYVIKINSIGTWNFRWI